ncbi:TPA: hypothetical protein ACGAUW_005639, partial [Klebsiella pneumoniae]
GTPQRRPAASSRLYHRKNTMKYGITLLMLCLLAGCAQRNTQLPPVSGNPEPVNSPAIIQELTPHV